MPTHEYDFIGQGTLQDAGYEQACRAADDHSVSLVSGNNLIGSATLVSIGNICGLLTADHVWQFVLRGDAKDHFCMLVGRHLHRFEYPFEHCNPIIIGNYSPDHEEEGPDLAFIRLNNPLKLGIIKSRKSFYPLNASKGRIFDK